jgi:hypothetical protein
MKRKSSIVPCAVAFLLGAGALASAQGTQPLAPAQQVAPEILVQRIEVNCLTSKNARAYDKPVNVALRTSNWAVVSDADFTAADRTRAAAVLAQVYKRDGKYVWVQSHTWTQSGAQRATDLCFREDGTLARVRQAESIPALDAAGVRTAYFNTDGSVIQSTTQFVMEDPAIKKRIADEPYYQILPQ